MKTKGKLFGTITFAFFFAMAAFAGNYEIDKNNSQVKWSGKKVTGEHYGTIGLKNGTVMVEDGKIAGGTFVMDMNTIVNEDIKNESMNGRLVGHLKSDDFFLVEKYPDAKLVLKDVKHKSGDDYTFTGHLTIKEITHPVTFNAKSTVADGKLTSKGKIEVDRTLYDIKFRSGKFFSDLGDNLIYDTFTLDFDVVASPSSGEQMSGNQ
ncbi:MAG: YceI family protein [Tangfeifania sp.]